MSGTDKQWTEIDIHVSEALIEAVSNRLMEEGANGVVIEDRDAFWENEDGSRRQSPDGRAVVRGYFPADSLLDLRSALESYLRELKDMHPDEPEPALVARNLPNNDWAHEWRKFFKPTKITEGVVVKPTWEPYTPAEDELVIEIDPGMAFGTGLHATTRLCMQEIKKYVWGEDHFGARAMAHNALDVGTGSGILAILMAKLGVGRTVAIDNDPVAVDVAQENIELNHVQGKVLARTATIDEVVETFNLVVANIIAEVILDIRDQLIDKVQPGGHLILSGILKQKGADVRRAFIQGKLDFIESSNEGEWTCLVFRKT